MHFAKGGAGRRSFALGLTILVHSLLLVVLLAVPRDLPRLPQRSLSLSVIPVLEMLPPPAPERARHDSPKRTAPHATSAPPLPERPAAAAPILSVPAPLPVADLAGRPIPLADDDSGIGSGSGSGAGGSPRRSQPPAASDEDVAVPVWVRQPTRFQMAEEDPDLAKTMHVSGQVLLHCRISLSERAHDCRAVQEDPKGYGFGNAAVRLARHFRIRPVLIDGVPTADAKVAVPVSFDN